MRLNEVISTIDRTLKFQVVILKLLQYK